MMNDPAPILSLTEILQVFSLPAFVFGATEMAKIAGMQSKYLPFFAVAMGAVLYPLLYPLTPIVEGIVQGGFIGMIVTGMIHRFGE